MSRSDFPEYEFWRPEMDPKDYRREINSIRRNFRRSLSTQPETVNEEMVAAAEANAAKIVAETGPPGPFVEFNKAWLAENPETESDRRNRIVANYLRHDVCQHVDEALAVREVWFVPGDWFDTVWEVAMQEIVARYPELKSAKTRGARVKKAYREGREEARRLEEERLIRSAELSEEARTAAQKALREARSTSCRSVSSLFSVGDAVTAKYRSRMYDAVVIKVNSVTIHVEFRLKSGTLRSEKVWACSLWEWADNRDTRPAPRGYVPFSEEADRIMSGVPRPGEGPC